MKSNPDPETLYRSPDGYEKVIAHYDQTLNNMGIPYQSQYIETNYGRTHLVIYGKKEGKPVVLWHGQNANIATWVRWIPELATNYSVFAIDTIGGLGKSAQVRLSRKGSAYGEWAAEVLRDIHVKKGNMIGISNGGWLVLKLGSEAPQMIGSAVLMSSAGLKPLRLQLIFKIIRRSLSKDPRVIAQNLVQLLSPPDFPLDSFYVDFFELILRSKFKGEPIAPRIRDEEIKKLTAPAYVLMGEYERSFNPFQALERAINLLPALITAEIVPGVGHSMEHRDPDWVIPRVMNFLDEYAV